MYMHIYTYNIPPPLWGLFVEWFPDPEPCVRDFTTRCDGRISS